VHENLLPRLAEGVQVTTEVEQSARGPRALRVWQHDEDASPQNDNPSTAKDG